MIDADYVRNLTPLMDNIRRGEIYYPVNAPQAGALAYKEQIRRANMDVTDIDAMAAAGTTSTVERIQILTSRDSQELPSPKWVIRDLKTGEDWIVLRATRTSAGAVYDCLCALRQAGSAEA